MHIYRYADISICLEDSLGKIKGFTEKQKEEILHQSKDFWDTATTHMAPQFALVDERERLARGKLPQDLENAYSAFKDRSALVPPDIYNNMNSLRAHFRRSLFSKTPYLKLSHPSNPLLRDGAITKAELTLQGMNDKAEDGVGLPSQADRVFYQAAYAGLSCVFTKWTKEIAKKAVRNKQGQLQLDENGEVLFRNEVVAQYAEDIPLDIRRVRWNQNAAETKDIRTVGYHSLSTLSDLLVLNRTRHNHYEFNEKDLRESSFTRSKYFEHGPENPDAENTSNDKGFSDDMVEVQSIRGLFRFEDSKGVRYQDLIVEIGNRTIVLGLKKNDLPISGWDLFSWPSIIKESGRIWAMGIVEPATDTFVEMFVKRNQSIDGTNRDIHLKVLADSSAAEDIPEIMEHNDDQIIFINASAAGLSSVNSGMQYMNRPGTSSDPFNQATVLSQEIQQTMKLSDYLQGKDPSRQETATAVAAVVSGGQSLTTHMMDGIADTYLRPTSKKKLILWNFFMGDQERKIFMGGETLSVQPGEIDLPYNVAIETSLAATNPAAARRLVEVLPTIMNDPFYDGQVVRETLNEILDLPNKERLLVDPTKLERTIQNESIALGYGIAQEVDPNDNHIGHNEGHEEYRQFIIKQKQRQDVSQEEAVKIEELGLDVLEEHMGLIESNESSHNFYIEQQQQAIGNTKELGGNTGSLVQPDGASQNSRSQSGRGNFTPRENR